MVETNKLSIYLIKEVYSNYSEILKDQKKLQSEQIAEGMFFYGDSYVFSPSWLQKFFTNEFDNKKEIINDNNEKKSKLKIFNASSKGIFCIKASGRLFAITFGYGHTFLKHGVSEERFGLKVVLNIIDDEKLRSIDKKSMASTLKLSREQIAKVGSAADFGINIEQDLIQGITGLSKFSEFGNTVTGKDALSISIKVDISNIQNFLSLCLKKYESDDYKTNFKWIDQISEIKDPQINENLNGKLIEKINDSKTEKTWMAVPEVIDWEGIKEFRFGGKNARNQSADDIDLNAFMSSLSNSECGDISLELLNKKHIYCIGAYNDEVLKHWKAYNCIYAEIEEKESTYILSNGRWYEIAHDFAREVNQEFSNLSSITTTLNLPKCQSETEGNYNERVANEINTLCLMDKKNIVYGGGYSKIEFCDLFSKDKKQLIHVKHYGGSSVLSHLFSQGVISGELFLADEKFREKVNDKLQASYKFSNFRTQPNAREYEIVFAVISKPDKPFEFPFFSKVNARNARRILETFGYKVSLVQIPNIAVTLENG